jgi:M6 family metalloprotease-like protein
MLSIQNSSYPYSLLSSLLILGLVSLAPADEFFAEAPLTADTELGFFGKQLQILPSKGSVNVLVVFAQFKDEASGDDRVPDLAADLFNPQRPGSFTHFYHTMSSGQLEVSGTVLPQYYTSRRPGSAYVADRADAFGLYGEFVLDILHQVDADYDLSVWDNDGPDDQPNSGDDDGALDYLFVMLRSVPHNFIIGRATGYAELGFKDDFVSNDVAAGGAPIRVVGSQRRYGSLMQSGSYAWTTGLMVHEFGHALGLPDLFDRSHLFNPDQPDAEYGAGIGRWGLMGTGALGWQHGGRADGPNALSAWSLEQLGWIGINNERLVEIERDTVGVTLVDPFAGGKVYKIVLRTELARRFKSALVGQLHAEYLLLEYRSRDSHYYSRQLPAEGLLIWHVRGTGINNDNESHKLVDLICADGLFEDGGYGTGSIPSPRLGYDNLDFWAKSESYRTAFAGNEGDATDLFDGVRYHRLDTSSNPSTLVLASPEAYTPVQIRITHEGDEALTAAINFPYWGGTVREEVEWVGDIRLGSDLVVAQEGKLVILPNTRIQVEGQDRLESGLDSQHIEVSIEGALQLEKTLGASSFRLGFCL